MKFLSINKDNYTHVQEIYKEGINTEIATFETEVPNWSTWDKSHHTFARILAVENDTYLGWAALSTASKRIVYNGVAEVSVYVSIQHRGKKIGQQLLRQLILISEANSIWTLQSGIMKANESSIKMHLNCGFRIIGYREKIGKLNNKWLDNIILERRSIIIGI